MISRATVMRVQVYAAQSAHYILAFPVLYSHIPTRDNRTSVFSYGKRFSECAVSYLSSDCGLYLEQLEQPESRLSHFLFRYLQAAHACDAVLDNDGLVENERMLNSH
jgi:hypothetical protein